MYVGGGNEIMVGCWWFLVMGLKLWLVEGTDGKIMMVVGGGSKSMPIVNVHGRWQ